MPGQARFCPACGSTVTRLSTGQVLDGKYEILDKIGEGGMGEVYRARHVHLDEVRIIKVTKPGAAGDVGQARRFQEEARIATLVRHPNVAALYDFSRMPDGSYYMVWEFIDGVTLETWLRKRGPLPLARALEVAGQVLSGLAEIHAQGIVHRDLSPDNVMLRETPGGRLQAKIIDLGIAKRVASEPLAMTGTGLFLGKLRYCSPEQAGALPAGQTLDGRSDLYSFGAVLYEMVSGKPPFESPTPEGYIGKHLHEVAAPLDPSKLPGEAGRALSAVLAKALEKKRERRYSDAREFAQALARIEAVVGQESAESSPEPPATPHSRRLRLAAQAAAAIAIVVLLGLGAHAWSQRRQPRKTTAARGNAAVRKTLTPAPAPATATPSVAVTAAAEPPTPPPTAAPPAPEATPAAPRAGPTPAEARNALARWRARPAEARARRAPEVARMADRFVESHPDDPLSAEIRESLPVFLRSQAADALDRAQPLNALLYFRAYKQLSFAPPAPELQSRIERLK